MGREQKKLVFSATSIAFLLLLTWLYSAFFANNGTNWSSKESGTKVIESSDDDLLKFLLRRLVRGDDRIQLEKTGFACHSDLHSEVCVASKPVRIDNNALTMYIPSSSSSDESQINRTIKPYANSEGMDYVTSVKIVTKDVNLPACDFTHNVPAVVFSSGGFAGNLFHEINEMIIPLFITTRHFRSQVKFVITDFRPWWVSKYRNILKKLSDFDVIDTATNGSVHCFPGAVLGLKYHNFLSFNNSDIPGGYSMFDFKQFLREAYNLKIKSVSEIMREKPVLLLASRAKTRVFLNENELITMMKELGFEVVVVRPNRMSNLAKFTKLLSQCSVLVGAHGAGMTNEVFLPAGAVTVQVVPIGLDWASMNYFGAPAREMGVNYLEYKIEPEESTLIETYGRDDPVFTDIQSIFSKGYYAARAVYVDGQDLKINVGRFRETLLQAMELIQQSNPVN